MVPEDVYELTGVADPRLHPDGKRVAYVHWWIDREAGDYRSAICLAAVDGSEPPRRLTAGEERDSSPRWSPDGTRLAFTSTRGDDGKAQVYVLPLEGGEAIKLTDLKEDAGELDWAPDGSTIAFSSRVRDEAYGEEDEKKRRPRRFTRVSYKLDNVGWTGDRRQHLFAVAADGSGEAQQLTDGDFEHSSPAWSPDGRQLAFVSQRDDDWDVKLVSDVYVMAADGGGEPTKLTSSDGECESVVWSPDGSQLAFLYTPGTLDWPRHGQVAVIPSDGGEPRRLTTSLDRTCAPYPKIRVPAWDGDRIVFAVEDGGNVHLYDVPEDGSAEPRLVVGEEQIVTGYDAAGDMVVYAASRATTPSELFVEERRLTDVGASFLGGRKLVEPERFTASSKDGTEVDCWLVRPADFEPGKVYPTLLSIHGGPFSQYHTGFFDEFQIYAGAGYAVVYANPRGSSGYSEEWGRAIRGPVEGGPGWGTVDYEDCIAVVDEAIKRFDFVDPDRLGVMGGSYGGYMTSWIVGHTDRFQCAISERAVNDMASEDGTADFAGFFRGYVGAAAWVAPAAYARISPLSYAADMPSPPLIIHSENDLRCPIGQGEDLFTRLRAMKREVEFVRFPAEGPELSRSGSPFHRVKRFEVILDWLGRYLQES